MFKQPDHPKLVLIIFSRSGPSWEIFVSSSPHRYLHSGSLNDGVQELVVLCHLLGGNNFWLASVALIVIQEGDKGCRSKRRHSDTQPGRTHDVKLLITCLSATQSYRMTIMKTTKQTKLRSECLLCKVL